MHYTTAELRFPSRLEILSNILQCTVLANTRLPWLVSPVPFRLASASPLYLSSGLLGVTHSQHILLQLTNLTCRCRRSRALTLRCLRTWSSRRCRLQLEISIPVSAPDGTNAGRMPTSAAEHCRGRRDRRSLQRPHHQEAKGSSNFDDVDISIYFPTYAAGRVEGEQRPFTRHNGGISGSATAEPSSRPTMSPPSVMPSIIVPGGAVLGEPPGGRSTDAAGNRHVDCRTPYSP